MTYLFDWSLFGTYCFGMAVAIVFSLPYKPAFYLRLFYAAVIVVGHYKLALNSAALGQEFYMYCGLFQFAILICALFVACSATLPVAFLALIACIINTLSYYNYPSHSGIWTIYYGGMNAIQTMQISSLIFFSPVSLKIIKQYTNWKNKGAQSWMLRRLLQEM